MRVVVLGGGIAGTAAAWAARRAGVDVTVVFDRAGASSLYSGALDVVTTTEGGPLSLANEERDLSLFATAFEAWTLGPGPARVATYDGVVRRARGHDTAVLDLSPLAGRTISVADTPLEHFDARSLARSFSASAWAKDTRTRFEPVKVPGLVEPSWRRAACFDVALRADAEDEAARLVDVLTASNPSADAWLLGPWLGTRPGAAERLRSILTVPCGETTSPPGGPAGARFDASRDSLLATLDIRVSRGPVTRLRRGDSGWVVTGGGLSDDEPAFDVAVLATGGVCAGGLVLGSSTFRVSIDVPVTVALDGRELAAIASSLSGSISRIENPEALVRLGIVAEGALARGGSGLLVAGDCVEGRPRTALEAARAGIATMRTIRNSSRPSRPSRSL